MSMKQLLLHQFAGCQDEMAWTIPIQTALEGLTPEQAARKESEETHSIWQIVSHLTFWNDRYLQRFQGNKIEAYEEENEATFQFYIASEQGDWERAVDRVNSGLAAWRETLTDCEESDLHQYLTYQDGSQDMWWPLIANLAVHNAYHIGQIVYIRKQYGIWTNRL